MSRVEMGFRRRGKSQKERWSKAFLLEGTMEISTPVRIVEGNTDVLGVTVGPIPGGGECAVITSPSAITSYSITNKSVLSTWTFPSNKRESITTSTYVFSEEGYCFVAH